MTSDPPGTLPAYNRVSIRAVLVHEGEDPSAALAAAGLVNAVVVPVVLGDASGQPAAGQRGGIVPNLPAVLQFDAAGSFAAPFGSQPVATSIASASIPAPAPVTQTLPAAFGGKPLAPIRRPGR